MNKRAVLYFCLAVLPAMLVGEQPTYGWKWFVWFGTALYQGLLALKALDSTPSPQSSKVAESLAKLTELTESNPNEPTKLDTRIHG